MCNSKKIEIPRKSYQIAKNSNTVIAEYGHKHNEEGVINTKRRNEETYRTSIRRQRDKILYTGGFRRLQDKTQVMSATLKGDHRTRLTHTLEVEQIATSIADALGLNRDLVSAIALGHDVGHTPFGHAGESALKELLKEYGGFNHSIQSIKYLWLKYGKNIDEEIYEGVLLHDSDMFKIEDEKFKKQIKHCSFMNSTENLSDCKFSRFIGKYPSTFEAQVVIWADKIAYITHDLEDFLSSNSYHSSIIGVNGEKLEDILGGLLSSEIKLEDFELRDLIRKINTNLIETSAININNLKKETTNSENTDMSNGSSKTKKDYLNNLTINFDDDFRESYYELRNFIDDNYINSPEVQTSDARAHKIIKSLFSDFSTNYKLLPLEIRKEIDDKLDRANISIESKELFSRGCKIENKTCAEVHDLYSFKSWRIAEYIAGMSDSYAIQIYNRLDAHNDNYNR